MSRGRKKSEAHKHELTGILAYAMPVFVAGVSIFSAVVILSVIAGMYVVDDRLSSAAAQLRPMRNEDLFAFAKPHSDSSSLAFDHLVITTNDLQSTMTYFSSMGFTVVDGGYHEGNWTRNALVMFADGSYIELLSTTRFRWRIVLRILHRLRLLPFVQHFVTPFIARFMYHFAFSDGVRDVALTQRSSAAMTASSSLSDGVKHGILQGPFAMSRLTPAGATVSWRVGVPDSPAPFILEWVIPNNFTYQMTRHPNNATRLLGVEIAVSNLTAASRTFSEVLGVPAVRDDSVHVRRFPEELAPSPFPVRFELAAGTFVRLVQPGPSDALRELLELMENDAALAGHPLPLGGIFSCIFVEQIDPESAGKAESQRPSTPAHALEAFAKMAGPVEKRGTVYSLMFQSRLQLVRPSDFESNPTP